MPTWLTRAPANAVVLWQVSQDADVVICVEGLPVAVLPLWQLAQFDVRPAWLNVAPENDAVPLWQLSQAAVVAMWVCGLPVAFVPLWQLAQLDVTPA